MSGGGIGPVVLAPHSKAGRFAQPDAAEAGLCVRFTLYLVLGVRRTIRLQGDLGAMEADSDHTPGFISF
ncbi:MAG: hypothetical protein ACI9X4_000169 [Glaciecola sp.]